MYTHARTCTHAHAHTRTHTHTHTHTQDGQDDEASRTASDNGDEPHNLGSNGHPSLEPQPPGDSSPSAVGGDDGTLTVDDLGVAHGEAPSPHAGSSISADRATAILDWQVCAHEYGRAVGIVWCAVSDSAGRGLGAVVGRRLGAGWVGRGKEF